MSVPTYARTESKLEVCVKAHEVACYTIQITGNEKVFKPEFQRSLTDKINDTAIGIFTLVWSANNVNVRDRDDLENRTHLQERAAIQCNVLLPLIEIAWKVFHLSSKRVQYWSRMVIETRGKTGSGKVYLLIDPQNVKRARRKLARLVGRAKTGLIPRHAADDSFAAWKNHASKGSSYRLLKRMETYYKNLWEEKKNVSGDSEQDGSA